MFMTQFRLPENRAACVVAADADPVLQQNLRTGFPGTVFAEAAPDLFDGRVGLVFVTKGNALGTREFMPAPLVRLPLTVVAIEATVFFYVNHHKALSKITQPLLLLIIVIGHGGEKGKLEAIS